MELKEAIRLCRELEGNPILDSDLSDDLNELANQLEVIDDFYVNGFKLEPSEICELYTSVRSDLVDEVKEHKKKCKAILEKAKF